MKRILITLFVVALVLSGCGKKEEHHDLLPSLDPIMVEIHIIPEQIEANATVTIVASVTQKGKNVDDASEVVFELWENGDEDHEMIPGTHQGNGQYRIEKSFAKEGTYSVIAHVTARNMHSMPKKEFVVGQGN